MRADAKKNHDQLLTVAREVIARDGAEASLRDIARKAGVGLGTLYRHFPSREALLEALLRASLDELTLRADQLQASVAPDAALVSWLREGVAFVRSYSGVVDVMAASIADPGSALHASCAAVRSSGARLLLKAQEAGSAEADIDGVDLFALISALGWLGDQPAFASRADRLVDVVVRGIFTGE